MPCNTVQRNSVELACSNSDILLKALTALQLSPQMNSMTGEIRFYSKEGNICTIRNGKVVVRAGQEYIADEIKQAYSREVVKAAAVRFRWDLKQTDVNKFQVTRRF